MFMTIRLQLVNEQGSYHATINKEAKTVNSWVHTAVVYEFFRPSWGFQWDQNFFGYYSYEGYLTTLLLVKPKSVERITTQFSLLGFQLQTWAWYLGENIGAINWQFKYVQHKVENGPYEL